MDVVMMNTNTMNGGLPPLVSEMMMGGQKRRRTGTVDSGMVTPEERAAALAVPAPASRTKHPKQQGNRRRRARKRTSRRSHGRNLFELSSPCVITYLVVVVVVWLVTILAFRHRITIFMVVVNNNGSSSDNNSASNSKRSHGNISPGSVLPPPSHVISDRQRQTIEMLQQIFPIRCGGRAILDFIDDDDDDDDVDGEGGDSGDEVLGNSTNQGGDGGGSINQTRIVRTMKRLPHLPRPEWNDEDYDVIQHPGIAFSAGGIQRMKMLLPESITNKMNKAKSTNSSSSSSVFGAMLRVPKFWDPIEYGSNHHGDNNIRSFLGDNGRRLLSPDEAALIGSYVSLPDKDDKDNNEDTDTDGNEVPLKKLHTIFVSVANYRDAECQPTVVSILERAKYPERVRIGIVDQIDFDDYHAHNVTTVVLVDGNTTNSTTIGTTNSTTNTQKNNSTFSNTTIFNSTVVDPLISRRCYEPTIPCKDDPDQVLCRYQHLVDVYEVPAYLMVGPVLARHIGHRMYRGEYFAMQVDAHVRFVEDWDSDIIEQWEATNNEMAVLSTYMTDIEGSIDNVTHRSLRTDRNILCRVDYAGSGLQRRLTLKQPTQQKEPYPFNGSPVLHPFWSAGFSFSRGHFVLQVPYDQYLPMIFQGEESSIMIRGYTYGYDYYAPSHSVAYHIYAIRSNIDRRKRHKFWENDMLYMGALEKSTARMNYISGLLKDKKSNLRTGRGQAYLHIDEDKYGVGMVRSREMYFKTFGIHPEAGGSVDDVNQLCNFVQNKMHPLFTKQIRPDRMGVDYESIDLIDIQNT